MPSDWESPLLQSAPQYAVHVACGLRSPHTTHSSPQSTVHTTRRTADSSPRAGAPAHAVYKYMHMYRRRDLSRSLEPLYMFAHCVAPYPLRIYNCLLGHAGYEHRRPPIAGVDYCAKTIAERAPTRLHPHTHSVASLSCGPSLLWPLLSCHVCGWCHRTGVLWSSRRAASSHSVRHAAYFGPHSYAASLHGVPAFDLA
jgi:hypothetical protein